MADEQKTHDQLIEELNSLRQRIADLESSETACKVAEEALKDTEQQYKILVQTIPDILYELDTEGQFTFISDSIGQFGYDPQDLLGRHFREIIHPEDFEAVCRYAVLPRYEGKSTGDERSPKLFDERRTASRMTKNLVVRMKVKVKEGEPQAYRYVEIHSSGKWDKDVKEKEKNFLGSIGIIRDISERKQAEDDLRYRLKFEGIITVLSTHFLNLPVDEIDKGITEALGVIGEFAGVDRSYLFIFYDEGKRMDNTHEWCAEGIEHQMNNLKGIPAESLPWAMDNIDKFGVIYVPSVANLPPEAGSEKEHWQKQDIQSLVVVPMINKGNILGLLGFDSVRTEKEWSEEIIALLKILGEIFMNALGRKWTERAFRESMELYRTLIETSPDAIVLSDIQNNKVIMVNPQAAALFGYEKVEDMKGNNIFDLIAPEDKQKAFDDIQGILETNSFKDIEYAMMKNNGSSFMGELSASVIFGEDGKPKSMISVIKDVTQRRMEQQQLQVAEEKYRNIFENSAVAIMLANENENIISWNSFTEHLLGMGKESLYMKPVRYLYPEDEWKKIRAYNVRKKGMQHHLETRMMKGNGEIIDVDVSISVVKDKSGNVTNSIGIIRDITERKKAEQQLVVAEEKYRTIFENSAVAIMVVGKDENIVSWNKFAENLLGMEKSDLYLRPVSSLYPGDEWVKIRAQNVRQKGMQHHLETRMIKKDGEIIDVDISISVVRDESGQITNSIGIIRDITERKQAETMIQASKKALEETNRDLAFKEKELRDALYNMKQANEQMKRMQAQLVQSEKMVAVGQLSVGIAHEIKNPLAIITQGVELIERLLVKHNVEGARYTGMVKNAASRAADIITELLTFSRSSQLELKPLNLHELIDKAVKLVRTKSKFGSANVVYDFEQQDIIINGDSILIEEVFLNLLSNAVDAVQEGGEIRITTRFLKKNETVSIEFADSGEGIPEENLKHIFDPFFTTKESGHGTGLGLSIVYSILERHNGTIRAESKPGEGTKFTIILPVYYPEEQ